MVYAFFVTLVAVIEAIVLLRMVIIPCVSGRIDRYLDGVYEQGYAAGRAKATRQDPAELIRMCEHENK